MKFKLWTTHADCGARLWVLNSLEGTAYFFSTFEDAIEALKDNLARLFIAYKYGFQPPIFFDRREHRR